MRPEDHSLEQLSDHQLDEYVLARLKSLGVDLSVLPEDDPESPADRKRILASARSFLRSTPEAIAAFRMDPQEVVPGMYPAVRGGRSDP